MKQSSPRQTIWIGRTLKQLLVTVASVIVWSGASAETSVQRGEYLTNILGCGGCHTIEGLSAGVVGPNQTNIGSMAETRIPGMSAEDYIRESILDPSAYIVEGYQDNIMPKNYDELIEADQLDDLVAFLLAQQ